MSMLMVLVTGGTGFVGSYLLFGLLGKHAKVRSACRKGSDAEQVRLIFDYLTKYHNDPEPAEEKMKRIDWVEADMTDYDSLALAVKGVDIIYHTAARVDFDPSKRSEIIANNAGGTAFLINAAIEEGVERFVHVSSVAALNRRHNEAVDEADIKTPDLSSVYAESKYRAEMEVWRGEGEGMNVCVVNPGVIFGPCDFRREGGSASFFMKIYKGLPFYPAGSNAFVDVRDVAGLILKLSQTDDAYGQRFILISENLPYKEVIFQAARELEVRRPRIQAGLALGYIGWAVDRIRCGLTGKRQLITRDLVNTSAHNFGYSNKKVIEATGWQFIPVKQSVSDTCRFLRQLMTEAN